MRSVSEVTEVCGFPIVKIGLEAETPEEELALMEASRRLRAGFQVGHETGDSHTLNGKGLETLQVIIRTDS